MHRKISDTKEKKLNEAERRLHWAKICKDWETSQLTIKKYCNNHGISRGVFHLWKSRLGYPSSRKAKKKTASDKKLKQPASNSSKKMPAFVKVNLSHDDIFVEKVQRFPVQIEIILKNGRHVKFCYPNHGQEVTNLLNMLEALPC